MKIGITGQSGFIGSSVSKVLSQTGYEVIPLDNYIRSCEWSKVNPEDFPHDFKWVLHFAASTSIQSGFRNPFFTYYNNVLSTLLTLKIADAAKSSFLFMSSYVYGQPQYLPIDEKHPLDHLNPYMGSKIIGEELCQQLCSIASIPLVVLRGSNIYGDCHIPGRLIPDLLESICMDRDIILNDPAPRRDYLYIKDFISLILNIIDQEPVKSGIYNVGYGCSYSNLEVAKIFRGLTDNKRTIEVKSQPRQQDVIDCSLDVSLVKETFSWSPKYSLEAGLSELLESHLYRQR